MRGRTTLRAGGPGNQVRRWKSCKDVGRRIEFLVGLDIVLCPVRLLSGLVVLQRRVLLRAGGRFVTCGLDRLHLLGSLRFLGCHWDCPFWTFRE